MYVNNVRDFGPLNLIAGFRPSNLGRDIRLSHYFASTSVSPVEMSTQFSRSSDEGFIR